ncbi:NAD(P)/FAD-dependent oxidoreductase [Aquipuribacter sp. SD81]|uniref:NAD(P)/FAD-dependent oxidoreductase n=1 Tax=Aquipuribacter sp. SD81 TaxID=3127703 RepID=UPI00301B631E
MTVSLPSRADVVVVGGGVMGTSVAFHLAEAGVDVLLLERDGLASGSSGKPVGGVRAQFSDPVNVALGARSLRAFADFARRPGDDIGLRRVGYLFLLDDPAQLPVFEASLAVQHAHGVTSRLVDVAEATRLNPYVDGSRYLAAAWSPEDGWARPAAVVHGYAAAARRHGATVRTGTTVTGVEVRGGEVVAVATAAGTVRTSTVVCCAGAWSRTVGAMVGVDLPVEPLRRQIAFSAPLERSVIDRPFTIDATSTFYVHGADDGVLLGWADPDQPVGDERRYDPSWLPRLRERARRCVPALADVPLVDGWAGLYEVTPDRNALVGEAPDVSRFLYAAGFSGHGFLQGPAVGEAVRDLVLGREPVVDVSSLDVARLATDRHVREVAIV